MKNAIIPKLTQKPLAVESQSQLKAIYCQKLITTTVNCNRKQFAHKNQLLTKAIHLFIAEKPITHESCLLPKVDCYRMPTATARQSLYNEITPLST